MLSGLSAQLAILYLFHKKKRNSSLFAHEDIDTRNTSEAELLYKFDINNHINVADTPTENLSQIDENDRIYEAERKMMKTSMADPDV